MAIFIVLLSVSFVSAVDDADVVIAEGNATDDTAVDDTTDADDDEADDETTDEELDDDEEDLDVGDNPYRHGELTPNEKAALADQAAGADAGNAAGSSDNAKTTSAGTNATGNPLLVLVAAIAALGIYPLSRRK